MDKQSFNLNADFLGGYTQVFIKIVIAIILVYGFIILVNFFRDKFINTDSKSKNPEIIDLLTILNKLFFVSGFGFILGNLVEVLLQQATGGRHNTVVRGDWDYLTFGVILIFIGIGFKVAKKVILKEKQDSFLENYE